MLAPKRPTGLRFAHSLKTSYFKKAGSLRGLAFFILIGFLASVYYLPSSATSFRQSSDSQSTRVKNSSSEMGAGAISSALTSRNGYTLPSLGSPLFAPEGIATFADDCTTPKDTFELGETVCAKASGVPVTLFPWHITWTDPNGNVRDIVNASENEETTYTYTLPATSTSVVNDQIVDNRGTWRANLTRSNGALRQSASFTVHEAANPVSDVFVQKISRSGDAQVSQGNNIDFILVIGNLGPDAASAVHLLDSAPDGGTLVQFTQTSGPACVPVEAGVGNDCIIATMNNGDRAEFTAIYNTGSATPGTYETSATVSTTTTDQDLSNNSSTTEYTVTAASSGATCEIICPDHINAVANTTESTVRGAHVTYDEPVSSGDCGSISTVPASGSFFPVGTTTVTSTSETGGGSCSFTITVIDEGSDPPTISCPANPPAATANGSCSAPVTVGNATATGGSNVTLFATRSDGKPMYNCDANGNCTRRSSDDPFSSGETTITWFAYSHDVAGPYTTAGVHDGETFEEQHRSGTAFCTQTVTVNDVTPPTITPPANQTASAGATCQFTLPDYTASASVSDNCACASSDTSEICDSREPITITQSPAPGTVVGLGPHTITLTANDGSSNNGGAGNTASAQFTVTVNDTTAPTVTAPADSSANADASCQAPVPNYVAGSTAADNCDSSLIMGQSPAAGTLVGKGPHTVTVTATDDAGNVGSDTVVFTVNDVTPPVISCQVDIVVDFNGAVNGAVVTYTPPVGSDNCSGATTAQIAGLPSGATFPVGTTTNTFRVTDGSGNTAECSFKVTVALTSIIGLNSVTITGAAYVDSYSSAGGYPATKGSLANVLSNGTITMGNSGKVWGNVRSTQAGVNMSGASQVTGNATAATTVTTSGSASVGGTRTNNSPAPPITLPSVAACGPPYSSNSGITGTYSYNASTGDLTLNGVNIATLANGNYCFHNVTLGNSSQLKVNGPVVIKLTGTLNTSGATSVNNTTQIPSNLRILSSSTATNGFVLGNSTSIYAVFYGPNTGLNVSGAVPLFGTAAAKTITLGNSGAIHYDTQLKTIWPALWTLILGP